jgi:hypothetical protein
VNEVQRARRAPSAPERVEQLGAEAFREALVVDAIGIRNLFPGPPLVPQKMTKEDLDHPATVLNAPNQRI